MAGGVLQVQEERACNSMVRLSLRRKLASPGGSHHECSRSQACLGVGAGAVRGVSQRGPRTGVLIKGVSPGDGSGSSHGVYAEAARRRDGDGMRCLRLRAEMCGDKAEHPTEAGTWVQRSVYESKQYCE